MSEAEAKSLDEWRLADVLPPGAEGEPVTIAAADERNGALMAAMQLRFPPGHALVFLFHGFGVVSTPDGSALILPSRTRELLGVGPDAPDRAVFAAKSGNSEAELAATRAKIQAVLDVSLSVWPKAEVP